MRSSEREPQVRVFLSLGSNLGDRRGFLESALGLLADSGLVPSPCSSVYETEPVDLCDQGDFLNLVCEVRTSLTPLQLLHRCQAIEGMLGRRRSVPKGPRCIDLDVLLYGDLVMDTPRLRLPHPGLPNRRFVLVPLVEIAPLVVDPLTGLTAAQLLERCPDPSRVVRLGAVGYRVSSSLSASANRSPRSR